MKVYLNGFIVDEADARISAFDRGFGFSDGVYETMRTYQGKLFALEDHLSRLRSGCSMLRLRARVNEAYWRPRILELLEANGLQETDARVRLILTRGSGLDLEPTHGTLVTEVIYVRRIDENGLEQRKHNGVRARIISMLRAPESVLHQIKTISLLQTVLARFECADSSVEEGIFCNTRDEICEATTSNVFVIKDEMLATPHLESPCIPGITRRHIMILARQHGREVEERAIPVDELMFADEAFTCASVSGIVPLVEIHGRKIGSGLPGPVTLQYMSWWREYVEEALSK